MALYQVIPGLLGKGFAIRPHHLPPPGSHSSQVSLICLRCENLSVVSCVLSGLRQSGRKGQTSAGPAAPAAGTHAGSVPETENRVTKHT